MARSVVCFGDISVRMPPIQEAYAVGERGLVRLDAYTKDGECAWTVLLEAVPERQSWLGRLTWAQKMGRSLVVVTHGEAPRGGTSHGYRVHRVDADGAVVWSGDVGRVVKGAVLHGTTLVLVAVDRGLDAGHPDVQVTLYFLDWKSGAVVERRAHTLRSSEPLPAGAKSHNVRLKRRVGNRLRLEVRGSSWQDGKRKKWSFEDEVPAG